MNCVWGVEDAEGIHSKKEVNHGGVARDYHGERGVACIQLIHAFTNGFHRSPPHFFQLFFIIFAVKNPGQNICPPLDLLIEAADFLQNLSTVAVQKSRHHSGTSQIHRQPIMLRGGVSFLYLHHFPVFPIPGKGNRYFPLCVVQQRV